MSEVPDGSPELTDAQAEEMLKQLTVHYGQPVMPINRYCEGLRTWQTCISERARQTKEPRDVKLAEEVGSVFLQISKSCLLSRLLYVGEKLRTTPCPVHKGVWQGIHIGWPGDKWYHVNGTVRDAEVNDYCQKWYDAGCRCAMDSCGCTTGWQPEPKVNP